ncbi:hypothetical protein [Cognatilysobacter terrigena]|uniref:hypothetical protein n=1 Tax=Cognatilysobacter terrigena TaxID=2488749 RepID=UPI00105F47F4|nr:hypothetical protein [Lysobacter terrigena]
MGKRYWDRSALHAELANFSSAAMKHARSPRTESSDSEFQAMFHEAARDLLALAGPGDREFVLDALERICRIHPHCNGAEISRLRADHDAADAVDVPRGASSDSTGRAASPASA